MAEITDEELRQRTLALLDEVDPGRVDRVTFRGAQYDHGLAWVHFPEGKGGLGIGPKGQTVVNAVLTEAGVTYSDMSTNPIGIGMGAPTVLTYGSEEHHAKHLRRIFTGEDIWCQMFSEPTHGSDVAGLASRAVRDGDEWVVNGQKVWTSLGHVSAYGMLLVRTNPDVPKHKGLTYFILDMSSPGVEVRPIYQITGDAEFNEVFFTDVRIPDSERLGDEGAGWNVAVTTLMNERVALGGGVTPKGAGPIGQLVDLWKVRAEAMDDPTRRVWIDRIADLWARAEVGRLTNQRAKAQAKAGNPGPEGSVGKLASAELNQAIYEACVDLLGAEGLLHTPGYPLARAEGSLRDSPVSKHFLRSRANTIEGGTSEIMRNILGERVLGLPGDVRVDKDLPWSEIPR